MSRKDRDRGGARPRPQPRPGAGAERPRGRARWPWVAIGVAAIVIGATWSLMRGRPAAQDGTSTATADPAAALTPDAAYQTALGLSTAGRHAESLPYYRRALAGQRSTEWGVRYNLAGELYNVGLETHPYLGGAVPGARSSIERVAMMREALAQMDTAEHLARNAHDRAVVIRTRGEHLQVWGLPWDAFVQLRRAQWTDSVRRELGNIADGYMRVLEHPERRPPGGTLRDRAAP